MIYLSREWPYIEGVAKERLKNNITSRHVSVYGESIETLGAAGELAARRFFGIPTELGTHFDGGTDIIYCGVRIDVKATVWTRKLQFRSLQWPLWKPIKADCILLVAVDTDRRAAILLGYATRNEVAMAPVNRERYDPCHEIPIQNLHSVSELMPSAPKSKRIQDPGFRNKIIGRDGVCLYGLHERAECSGGLDPHHIKTRGSGGDDTYDNGITLCRKHHSQAHSGHISADYLRLILNNYYKYEYPEVM